MTSEQLVDQVSIPGVPKKIGPATHAVLDYAVAGVFFAKAAQLAPRHRAASMLACLNGTMVLGLSLLTDYPGGVWRRVPFAMHGMMDIWQAALAGFGPMLMGFAQHPEARFFYAQAASEMGVVAATDWHAG